MSTQIIYWGVFPLIPCQIVWHGCVIPPCSGPLRRRERTPQHTSRDSSGYVGVPKEKHRNPESWNILYLRYLSSDIIIYPST